MDIWRGQSTYLGQRGSIGLAVLLVWGALSTSRVEAQVDPQPEFSLAYTNLTAARINPLGLLNFTTVSGRLRLFESESDAFKQNYVGFGLVSGLSPAFGRIGALVEVQPMSILRLYAQYEFVGYFGTFDLTSSYPTASADFSDSNIEARAADAATEAYASTGSLLTLGATLQLKVGPIAVRSLFRTMRADTNLRDGDRVFYDQVYDLLVPDRGWILLNDVDVLGVFNINDHGLAIGARYTYSRAFYRDEHFLPGEDRSLAPNTDVQRLGLLAAWTLSRNPLGRFDRPTVLLIAQWHLVHQWRTGQDVSQALPYLAIGFKFQGDLLADH